MQNIFGTVSDALQSVERAVDWANAAARAYHVGTGGDPTAYEPFGVEKPMEVAMNLAGAYAVDAAANIIAAQRMDTTQRIAAQRIPVMPHKSYVKSFEETYLQTICDIAHGNLGESERYIARNCANLAWRAGQPFRSLDRLARAVNAQFNTLPAAEIGKDDDQLRAAALKLLELLYPVDTNTK